MNINDLFHFYTWSHFQEENFWWALQKYWKYLKFNWLSKIAIILQMTPCKNKNCAQLFELFGDLKIY